MKPLKPIFLTLALLLTFAFISYGQKSPPNKKDECGTIVSENQKRVELNRLTQDFYKPLAPQANRPFWIPLSIHIVRQTDGTGGLTLENLKIAIDDLNRLWLPVGVQFYQHGNVDYINDDYFYTIPDNQTRRDELRLINPFGHRINVYFVGELVNLCGQSTFSNDPIQGVLMDMDCVGAGNSPSTLAHEIGHYFDLYHTHETAFGASCPSDPFCSFNGDLLCDTPADPELDFENNVNESCAWTGTAAPPSGCDSTPYNPPTRNVMSYSRRTCRNIFTPNQVNKALNVLTIARPNLFNTLLRFVAPDGGANSNCLYFTPCNTLTRAIQTANAGDAIFMLGGFYPGAVAPQNKAVTLRKWNTDAGDIILGQ